MDQKTARRAVLRLRLRPGKEEEYRRVHQAVWPSVLAACRQCGVRNYTIFRDRHDLYAYLEADDVRAALGTLARTPQIKRWQARMRPLLEVQLGPGAASSFEEVFHLD